MNADTLDREEIVQDLEVIEHLLARLAAGMPQDVVDDLERARSFVLASLVRHAEEETA